MIKILAFSGSARRDSYNQKLVEIAADGARREGAQLTIVNLGDFDMPIFNEDWESTHGMPESAKLFKRLLIEHDGFLIASPEYNSAFSPLLKNAIDWASRREEGESPLLAYRGKYASIMSASPGGLGGLRGLVFLRLLLSNIGVIVLPGQQAVANAAKAFNEDGTLCDPVMQQSVANLGAELAKILSIFKTHSS